jgi:hypothetical protein
LSDKNPYSLRNVVSEKLQIPKAKTELFKKTFTYSGPKLWKLPFSIWQASQQEINNVKYKRCQDIRFTDDFNQITSNIRYR